MDAATLHRRTVEFWRDTVTGIGQDQWAAPTPCSAWNVRDLVNHVTAEELWTVPLLNGATVAEVGEEFDGDVLGADPPETCHRAATAATSVADRTAGGTKVHLSYGDEDVDEYLRQLAAEHLVHGWDLAVATGGRTALDPELVEEVAFWFAGKEDAYRAGGAVAGHGTGTGDPQSELLAAFGRDPRWAAV